MTTYSAVLTNAGAALYASAQASSIPIKLTVGVVGDGGGSPVANPDKSRTTLVNQVYSTALASLTVDTTDPTIMWAAIRIAFDQGGWTIRELGLYTDGGVLFAIANFPMTEKAVSTLGSMSDLVINFGLKASNTALITLQIDPNVVTATRAWVLQTVTPALLAPGGTQHQVWKKKSATAGDAGWDDPNSPWQLPVATTGGNTAITALQAYNKLIKVTGALTAPAVLTFPAAFGCWTIINATTGNFPLTAIPAGGTGIAIAQGRADTVYCDGTVIAFTTSVNYGALGTASKLNASDQLGGVSAAQVYAGNPNGHIAGNAATALLPPSLCWDTGNLVMWACLTSGSAATAVWAVMSGGGDLVINGPATLPAGSYMVDTSAGPFAILLPPNPAYGTTLEFADAAFSWGINPLTINGNGKLIMESDPTLVCNITGECLKIWFNGSYWRLF